jgi:hypothetical protein
MSTTTTISTTSQAIRLAIFSAIAVGLTALGLGVMAANPPQQEQSCSLRYATMHDADGHMMQCDRMANGNHALVWQRAQGS